MNKQSNSEQMDTWKPLTRDDLLDSDGTLMPIGDIGRVVTGLMIRNLLQNAERRMLRDQIGSMRHPLSGRVIKINGPSYLKLLEYVTCNELQNYVLVLNKQGYWVAQDNDWVEEIKPARKQRRPKPQIGAAYLG